MASLEGNLNAAALQDILEMLTTKNPAATWQVSDGRDEKVVYFSTGGIRLYATDGRKICRLEEYLVKRNLVESDELERALEAASRNRRETLDEVLERLGFLPRARFLEVISDLIYLEICDLVTWENAIHEFYEGNPPPEIFDQEHPALFAALDVKAIAARVREWSQEWAFLKSKLHSERLRPRLAGPLEQVSKHKEIPSQTLQLYRMIDGKRTLRELAILSSSTFSDVSRLVRDGLRDGTLRATLVAEKDPTTQEEVLGEIERLEEALDKAINTILIHKRIALGYEKISEKDRASEHYQAVAELHAGAGRITSALENFHRAINLSPHNIGAHESLIRHLQESNQEDRALQEIVGLARKLLSFGLAERALDSLRAIKSKVLHLFEVRFLFAEILTFLGRGAEAIAEYLGIIREKKRLGMDDGIEEIYRKILALDPQHPEARSGLAHGQRQSVRKELVLLHRITGAAAAVLLAAWLASEALARITWLGADSEVRQSVVEGELEKGLEKLRAIALRYPANLLSASLVALEQDLFRKTFYKQEEDLELAGRLLREGKLEGAQKLYQGVASSKLTESQIQRAQEGLGAVMSQGREGSQLRRTAELYLSARLYEDAFAVCRKIIERNPEEQNRLDVPFFIRSDPTGADIKVNGIHAGSTPLWVVLRLGGATEVQVEKPGYHPHALQGFASRTSPIINVTLKKL